MGESFKNIVSGDIAEQRAKDKLDDEGYVCVKLAKKEILSSEKVQMVLNREGVMKLLEKYEGDKAEVLDMLEEGIVGLPDYICLKDGKISFVEVKANRSPVSPMQFKRASELKAKGFEWKVIRLYG